MELISQGAEAKLFRDKDKMIKQRISKAYRLPQMDESLRKFRTRREAKILHRLNDLDFQAPKLRAFNDKDMTITMDFIQGETLRDVFDNSNADDFQKLANYTEQIGQNLATFHSNNLVHGDLTTSNMLESTVEKKIKFIDFGLSKFSEKVEDKAVDLHLLDRALASKHPHLYPQLFEKIMQAYKKAYPNFKELDLIFERLKKVNSRGRNKK